MREQEGTALMKVLIKGSEEEHCIFSAWLFSLFKSTICCRFQISNIVINVVPHQVSTRKLHVDTHLEEVRDALSTLETIHVFFWVTVKDRQYQLVQSATVCLGVGNRGMSLNLKGAANLQQINFLRYQ